MKLHKNELRKFGLVLACVILLAWLLVSPDMPWSWLIALEAAVIGAAVVLPEFLMPAYWILTKFGLAISRVLNPLILAVVFYLLVTPMGVVMRVFGYDPLRLKKAETGDSFRISALNDSINDFNRPF